MVADFYIAGVYDSYRFIFQNQATAPCVIVHISVHRILSLGV